MPSPARPINPTVIRRFDLWSGVLAFGLTAVLFWPVSYWVVAQTLLRSQLQNALIILIATTGLALWRHGRRFTLQPRWSTVTVTLLVVAYGCGGLALATHVIGFMFLGAESWRWQRAVSSCSARKPGSPWCGRRLPWPPSSAS